MSTQEFCIFFLFTNTPIKHFVQYTHPYTQYTTLFYLTLICTHLSCDQSISLGLLRSDLMLESLCCTNKDKKRPYCCWKQVEINTIASGFGHLGPISREIQRLFINHFFIPIFSFHWTFGFLIFSFYFIFQNWKKLRASKIDWMTKIELLNWVTIVTDRHKILYIACGFGFLTRCFTIVDKMYSYFVQSNTLIHSRIQVDV